MHKGGLYSEKVLLLPPEREFESTIRSDAERRDFQPLHCIIHNTPRSRNTHGDIVIAAHNASQPVGQLLAIERSVPRHFAFDGDGLFHGSRTVCANVCVVQLSRT